ncbi:MAG: ATP-dependent DNA helicase RecG [Candidatus Marinimicrobia bacterium]|nr:ATP-dependent DNA helicase RecG [Candidatus Neomarinimicrobiota bacterium]
MKNYLQNKITSIPYIGKVRAEALKNIGIFIAEDLLYYFPRKYLDRSNVKKMNQLIVGEECTVVGKVERIWTTRTRRKSILKILIKDNYGYLTLNWFGGIYWIKKMFKVGDLISVSGKINYYQGLNIIHPDFDFLDSKMGNLSTGIIVPVYALTENMRKKGLNSRQFRKIFKNLFTEITSNIPDPIPQKIRNKYNLIDLLKGLKLIHFPEDKDSLQKARYRFKFQELLMLQSVLAIKRRQIKNEKCQAQCKRVGELTTNLYNKLPFELTDAQKRVTREIYNDLKSETPMNRLLQGDVGSGKTIVAAISAAIMTENNFQTVIMAPTEILAKQHYNNFKMYFEPWGINCELLIGKQTKKQRDEILPKIADGKIPIIVGTHALLQEKVKYSKLGLVIIDEQHRFGVDQRMTLIQKGINPHVLTMTATPIPRTMSISIYGDMDTSIIDEMPKGRKPVVTRVVKERKLPKVYGFLKKQINSGRQVFIVYPLISESEKMDLQAAEKGFEKISQIFSSYKVALLHSKLKKLEKSEVINKYKSGETDILVSTTVIEVGVDIPNATVMIIENAERFGLSQLHQLRGRIGRGSEKSYCILVSRKDTEQGNERLRILEETIDGFKISEADLKLRGPGEFFSAKQHGLIDLKIANLIEDGEILREARLAAFSIIKNDPNLSNENNGDFKEFFLKNNKDKLNYVAIG